MSEDICREAFEKWGNLKWWFHKGESRINNGSTYHNLETEAAWLAWKHQQPELTRLREALETASKALSFYSNAYSVTVTMSNYPEDRSYDTCQDDGKVASEGLTAINSVLGADDELA